MLTTLLRLPKRSRPRTRFFAILFAALAAGAEAASPLLGIGRMTTDGRDSPLGVPADDVSFAWEITSSARDVRQTAFEVRVGSAAARSDVWASGRIASREQIDIALPASIRLAPATRYFWQVRAWDDAGHRSDWSPAACFETGLLTAADWHGAAWIGRPAPADTKPGDARPPPLPLLRCPFTVTRKIVRARAYVSARGIYQLSINGRKVGDQYLAPGWTDYPKRIQVQTYDITSYLQPGDNVVGAALADGWYRGKVGLGWHAVYGDTLSLIARLRIEYADGSTSDVVTGPDWRTAGGPFVGADLQDGETYDARLEADGWDRPGFDAAGWQPARVRADGLATLVPQPDEPVRATQVLPARRRSSPAPGVEVYDLGQNMVGVARVRLRGRAGETVRIRYAEELYRDGRQQGRLYTDNFRTARVTDRYTFAHDGIITYQPTFTQHGFRYVEIAGAETPPEVGDVEGVVLGSDLRLTGDLQVSNPMLDQLVRNIRWGLRSNFLSIPTDTPARDERLGWTGDISVFAPTACRYADARAFLSKWMTDVCDSQHADGNIPAVVPQPRHEFDETGVGWSDAVITVPYAVWRATGDRRIIRQNWPAMLWFYDFVHRSATHDGDLLEQGRSSWFSGDWLSLEKVDRLQEHQVIATAYFAEDTRMMAEMAAAMGDGERSARWAALVPAIRAAFTAAYRDRRGGIYTGTQTAYAMALAHDMIADPQQRAETAARFLEKLAADADHLKTGFLGTPLLLPAIQKAGRDDLAMKLLLNDDYPSWGFEVRMGATTMWERWNGIRADGAFGPVEMNSFNHYAYGAVGDWLFQELGGLQILEPGYRRVRIAPLMGCGGLQSAQAEVPTPYGRLSCAWTVVADNVRLVVKIPPNTEAELVLPATTPAVVREGGASLDVSSGIHRASFAEGRLTLVIGSGLYDFTSTAPLAAGSAANP